MNKPKSFFDKDHSAVYDEHQRRMAPMMTNLHFLIGIILKTLPRDATILCVGVGTGAEIISLAGNNPDWHFTALDPSPNMLDVCRAQLEKKGYLARTKLVHGYLSDISKAEKFDAVISLFVTQFVKPVAERQKMFADMAAHLNPKGYLINGEISADMASPEFNDMFEKWKTLNLLAGSSEKQMADLLPAWQNHVAIVPPPSIENLLRQGGLALPVQFFQSLVLHAWYAQKQ